MEENKNGVGFLERLALISEACENTLPVRANILFELNDDNFKKVCELVKYSEDKPELKVEIGNTSFIFIREGEL
jgi:hypothetical protein